MRKWIDTLGKANRRQIKNRAEEKEIEERTIEREKEECYFIKYRYVQSRLFVPVTLI